jgi:thiamine biosynthesis lipoprotein
MIRRAQPWLGTLVEISAAGVDQGSVSAAFTEIARVHRLMSFHDAASDIARINRAAPGELVAVDPSTRAVLALALEVATLSGGAFDIACAPWLVARRMLPSPSDAAPAARASRDVFALADEGVRKLSPGWIDVGGIAKGYAVDAAVDALVDAGASGGCVNAGGDLRVFGALRLRVAVRAPQAPGRAACQIELHEEALATSGSYFSRRRHGDGAVSALVDARDGRALVAATSASVRAGRCAQADALTKVVLATGDCAHPALAAYGAAAFLI